MEFHCLTCSPLKANIVPSINPVKHATDVLPYSASLPLDTNRRVLESEEPQELNDEDEESSSSWDEKLSPSDPKFWICLGFSAGKNIVYCRSNRTMRNYVRAHCRIHGNRSTRNGGKREYRK